MNAGDMNDSEETFDSESDNQALNMYLSLLIRRLDVLTWQSEPFARLPSSAIFIRKHRYYRRRIGKVTDPHKGRPAGYKDP